MLKWAVGGRRSEPCGGPPSKRTRRCSTGKENSDGWEAGSLESLYCRLEAGTGGPLGGGGGLRDVSNYQRLAQTPPRTPDKRSRISLKRTRMSEERVREWVDQSPELKRLAPLRGGGRLVQIEFSPVGYGAPLPPSVGGDSREFRDDSSPDVLLDHKEIPLRQEEKDTLLRRTATSPGRCLALREAVVSRRRRLGPASVVSPLALRLDYLQLGCTTAGQHPLLDSPPSACWLQATQDTEDDRSVIGLRTPPSDSLVDSLAFLESVRLPSQDDLPVSTLRRMKSIRRPRRALQHPISALTLPDGLPSPFESPAVRARLHPPALLPGQLLRSSILTLPAGIPSPASPGVLPLSDTSTTSSNKISDEDDAVSNLGPGSAEQSPCPLVEERSRSRRCLAFTSPPRARRRPNRTPSIRHHGELELSLNYDSPALTINVIRAKNLQPPSGTGGPCNAYIKVSLVPGGEERAFHRTCVRKCNPSPRFDTVFRLQLTEADLGKRVLVSAWHRDRSNRKSEFLGCMSFGVKHAIKREISGTFRLLSQSSGRTKNVPTMTNSENIWHHQADVMANQSVSSVEELLSVDESDIVQPPDLTSGVKERKKSIRSLSKKDNNEKVHEEQIFLRHLELDPPEEEYHKAGRTPFTTTRVLHRQSGTSFGFSIAWTHPPRVERVEGGSPADQAGLRPGDYVIFVGKTNVVTLQEEEILQLIKSYGDRVVFEVYRKLSGGNNGTRASSALLSQIRPATACSGVTTTGASGGGGGERRRLHLPQVAFTPEDGGGGGGGQESRKRWIYQLLSREQGFALWLQFGIARFLVPLAERRDILTSPDHAALFQNIQELLRHTEDILELFVQDETLGQSVGKIYYKKMNALNNAYRRYCTGLKKADCTLVEKSRNPAFVKLITEPAVPKRRPDLTAFIHKPLEHFREVLKLLQTVLNSTKTKDEDSIALAKVVQEMQMAYREMTVESGLMEPEGEGKPLLSLQDLESRLVFTRCKPFVLSSAGRQWIFGGELRRVEGRSLRPFWVLLFTDLLLFARVSRDRVIFVTEDPLPLNTICQTLFSIRKKATEFRLVVSSSPGGGTDSPATVASGCAELRTASQRKATRRRTIALRAPSPELKAVWQSLIQRQIQWVQMSHGGTPASSPMDSPADPLTAPDSLDSVSLRRQVQVEEEPKPVTVTELIEHRCRQLGKSGMSKGSALHLSLWMRGQLQGTAPAPGEEDGSCGSPTPTLWSPDTLRQTFAERRAGRNSPWLVRSSSPLPPPQSPSCMYLTSSCLLTRCHIRRRARELGITREPRLSRCEEIDLSDFSSDDSQKTVRSFSCASERERVLAVCRKCHKTCLLNNKTGGTGVSCSSSEGRGDINANHRAARSAAGGGGTAAASGGGGAFSDDWTTTCTSTPGGGGGGTGAAGPGSSAGSCTDSQLLSPTDPFLPLPNISVQPPTPLNNNFSWAEAEANNSSFDCDKEGESEEVPYRSLSPTGLRRYGTLSSLERLEDPQLPLESAAGDQQELAPGAGGLLETQLLEPLCPESSQEPLPGYESVGQSLKGWTARAGSYVVEKIGFFERIGEDSRGVSFIDRYLKSSSGRPTTGLEPDSEELLATSMSCAGEEEVETSAATSGEEIWGTPTSGDSGLTSPNNEDTLPHYDPSLLGSAFDDAREQLMMDKLLSGMSLLGSLAPLCPVSRSGFPQRRRLDPLPEDIEESDTSSSSSSSEEEATKSYSTDQGRKSDSCAGAGGGGYGGGKSRSASNTPSRFFDRLKLRRSHSADSKTSRSNKIISLLRGSKSEEQTSSSRLSRLFSRDSSSDDIPTTLPPLELARYRREQEKSSERRFWKQLRKRRRSTEESEAAAGSSRT